MGLNYSICRERHAIAEFQAIVRFTDPLDPAHFGDVTDTVTKVAQELQLPARVATPSFAFEFSQGSGARFSPPPINPLAVGFQRFAANGDIEERINADPISVSYMTRQYLGWDKTRPVIANAIGRAAAQYTKQSQLVDTVQLQYSNEFSSNASGFVPAQELFREDTRWVPPVFTDLKDLWHSHVGMFLPGDGCKDLVNVNVDVVFATSNERSDQFTVVKLLILAARKFNVPEGRPLALTATETPEALLEIFDAAHDLEKNVFFETLSDEYLRVVNAK